MFIRLTDQVSVAGQLAVPHVADAAARGFVAIINNRPDDEAARQPRGIEIAAAAAAARLSYQAIPVGPEGMTMDGIAAMAAALDAAPGPLLAFCRSGTRSTHLWALAEAMRGGDPDDLIACAAAGGYDIAMLRPALVRLAGR